MKVTGNESLDAESGRRGGEAARDTNALIDRMHICTSEMRQRPHYQNKPSFYWFNQTRGVLSEFSRSLLALEIWSFRKFSRSRIYSQGIGCSWAFIVLARVVELHWAWADGCRKDLFWPTQLL